MNPEVELVPLTEEKLELVRRWRNSEPVRKQMEFQDEITPEMQRRWFESINNDRNSYTLIVYNGKEVGMNSLKNIDHAAKSAEGGIFIADPDCLNTPVPIMASLLRLDYCFETLGLEVIYGKTAEDNINAKRLNAAFGYEPIEHEGNGGRFRYYKLTKESYYEHRQYLIDLLYGTE